MTEQISKRFIVLDSWRGIAALLVAFGHMKTNGGLTALALSSTSYRFVDFFFILSGFVIAHSSTQRLTSGWRNAAPFLTNRLARLWPLHLFVLFFFLVHQITLLSANYYGIVVEPQAFSEGFSAKYLPANIFLIQAWDILPESSWNKPAWSISTELFAYIVFALTCVIARHQSWVIMTIFASACTLFIMVHPEIMGATYSFALVRCMAGFGTGVLAYQVYKYLQKIELPLPTLLELLTVIAIVLTVVVTPQKFGWLVLPVFFCAVLVFSLEQGNISRLLLHRSFVFLGERSYSIYLIHAFIALGIFSIASVFQFIGTLPNGKTGIILPFLLSDLLIIVFLLMSVVVSHFSFLLIERPGQRFGRNIIKWQKDESADEHRML